MTRIGMMMAEKGGIHDAIIWMDPVINRAPKNISIATIVAGIDSDRLYPLRLQAEIAEGLGNCVGGLQVVRSDKGHDGFLTEFDAIADLLKRTVDLARR